MISLPEDLMNSLLGGSMESRYRGFCKVCEDNGLTDEKDKVRFGIKIFFDIYDYFDILNGISSYGIIVKRRNGKVYIGNKLYNIVDFRTEIEERETLMMDIIISYNTQEEIAEPRVR